MAETISFQGIGIRYVTYDYDNASITYNAAQAGGSAQAGRAVTLSANAGVIALAQTGNYVLGKLISVESDGKCVVQTEGYMTLPGGTGATLTRGLQVVGAGCPVALGGNGCIRQVSSAVAAELAVMNGYIQDNAVTTAVWVLF